MTRNIERLFEEPEGATPLEAEDLQGLIPGWVATRADLNAVEQENILEAMIWAFAGRRAWTVSSVLERKAMADLHRRMFREVWRWAGDWRQRQTNLGVAAHRIVVDLETLLLDVRAQTADPQRLPWPPDEIAIRFHHRLVSIHPFANGNGRHARLAADLLVTALGRPRFTWGAAGSLVDATDARQEYLAALRTADREFEYGALSGFARHG